MPAKYFEPLTVKEQLRIDGDTEEVQVGVPNKAAAISLANRAAAFMALKLYNFALEDSKRSCTSCPEYVKAHYRKKKCL